MRRYKADNLALNLVYCILLSYLQIFFNFDLIQIIHSCWLYLNQIVSKLNYSD